MKNWIKSFKVLEYFILFFRLIFSFCFLVCVHYKVKKLATLVEGDPKAPFQYLLHWGVGEGTTPFQDCSTLPLILTCEARWHQVPFFKSLVWLDLGLKPGHSDHWRNTLLIRPMAYIYVILSKLFYTLRIYHCFYFVVPIFTVCFK